MHAAAAAAVLLVVTSTIAFVGREPPALLQPVQPAEPHLASIVALPFANASGDPRDEELAAALGAELFTARLAFVIALWGTVLYLGGTRWVRILSFPLLLLVFMIPIPAIIRFV